MKTKRTISPDTFRTFLNCSSEHSVKLAKFLWKLYYSLTARCDQNVFPQSLTMLLLITFSSKLSTHTFLF
jgi:hypothetical protein